MEMCFLGSKDRIVVVFILDDSPGVWILCADVSEHFVISEMSAHKIHEPENHPKERIQNSEHSESLKSRKDSITIYTL